MTRDETADLPTTTSIAETPAAVESARAKINLALHVVGRRPDGYHELDSLVVFAELSDILTACRIDEPRVEIGLDGPFADRLAATTPPGDNLVHLVADALMRAFPDRIEGGIRIDLAKHLPLAAGLGGGSADAAAALRLLNRIWQLGLATGQLIELGAILGADVPACVLSRPARIEGVGDRVMPLATLPDIPVVLVNPGDAVPTAEVFSRLRNPERAPLPPIPRRFSSITELVSWLRRTRNDLFEPACAMAPAIEQIVRMLAADPDCVFARMSGSGATVFGIFPSPAAASAAAGRVRQARPDWWVAATGTAGS